MDEKLKFLAGLEAEIIKAELLAFLDCEDIEVDSKEDFKEEFIEYIEEGLAFGDCK